MAKHCCKICCSGCCYKDEDDSRENLITNKQESREVLTENSNTETNATNLEFPLPQPLLTGHYIFVEGSILLKCTRFSINLQNGLDKDADKALHFNPRLEEGFIVRNTCINEKWGEEENWYPYKAQYTRPGKFKVSFFISPDRFLIAIDDRHYCDYKYRIPITKVTHLVVIGHVTVEAFYIREASEYPPRETINLPILQLDKPNHKDILPNPFTAKLPENLGAKWQVEMIGKVKLLPQSFYVNIQNGMYVWPHPIIPLHFNPRFYAGNHIAVRNAWHDGSWGAETRGLSQFYPGHKFHLIIRFEIDEFSIWVNGKMTGMFKSRDRENTVVDTFHVQGDVIIYKVWINKNVKSIIENMEGYSQEIFNEEE